LSENRPGKPHQPQQVLHSLTSSSSPQQRPRQSPIVNSPDKEKRRRRRRTTTTKDCQKTTDKAAAATTTATEKKKKKANQNNKRSTLEAGPISAISRPKNAGEKTRCKSPRASKLPAFRKQPEHAHI
jgi:hypothetical protein